MNRRSFFKLLGGAVVAAALPLGPLALPRPRHEEWQIKITDYAMSLDDFEARILEPAMQRLAERLDSEIMELLK